MRKWSAMTFFRSAALPGWFVLALLILSANAQNPGISRPRFGRSYGTTNPYAIEEQEMMQKALTPGFEEDSFTFARLKFDTDMGGRYGRGRRGWQDDAPEADLSLTYRLFQVTTFKIHPGLNYVDITPKELAKYPFVYVAGAGAMAFSDADAGLMRRYLLNGGFMMADDFWGDEAWTHFYAEMKRIFPDREPVELTVDHPIFHSVYPFAKEPQIPSVPYFWRQTSYDPADYFTKDHSPHFYAIFDDKNRMMALICHNNHFGDGWEHESENEDYFKMYSEPMGYPMFINILEYTMTH